jgi:hypothetical protein
MKTRHLVTEPAPEWLRTGFASHELGVHEVTLKRYADRDHILIEGVHWIYGVHPNSPRLWDVPKCREALAYRGRLNRRVGTAKQAS